VIAIPLLELMEEDPDAIQPVIIDLNLEYVNGRKRARDQVKEDIKALLANPDATAAAGKQGINEAKSESSPQYLFARLSGASIRELVKSDAKRGDGSARFERQARAVGRAPSTASGRTSRCARSPAVDRDREGRRGGAFVLRARQRHRVGGDGLRHRRFAPALAKNCNLDPKSTLHRDFTALGGAGDPLVDKFGHGTHVARHHRGAGGHLEQARTRSRPRASATNAARSTTTSRSSRRSPAWRPSASSSASRCSTTRARRASN
jgi:hypothetical protein